jgi:hypothetical protein
VTTGTAPYYVYFATNDQKPNAADNDPTNLYWYYADDAKMTFLGTLAQLISAKNNQITVNQADNGTTEYFGFSDQYALLTASPIALQPPNQFNQVSSVT